MLDIKRLNVFYGVQRVIYELDLFISEGSIVALIGANGAGKSTILKAVSGLISYDGEIFFKGKSIKGLQPHEIVSIGLGHVPEGRGIFGNLTVKENLLLSTWQRKDKKNLNNDIDEILSILPRLRERYNQSGGTLSGGEQQMLALARGLLSGCDMLMLDEPSMGLSPAFVKEVSQLIKSINNKGKTILLIEQNAHLALSISSYAYVIENGHIVLNSQKEELKDNPYVKEAYLGL